jgi:hypothetical protein
MYEYIDRELSEQIWIETLEMMSPDELAEMERRQEFEREQDFFNQAFQAMRETDTEVLGG